MFSLDLRARTDQILLPLRSKMQLGAVRTAVWMKDGLKARKDKLRAKLPGGTPVKDEPAVQSEV